jgi:hypothetical protein
MEKQNDATMVRSLEAAFPFAMQVDGVTMVQPGMTLRDYFAGQALAGMLAHQGECDSQAAACYRIADAMLAERAKRESSNG